MTVSELENILNVPIMVFDGNWADVFSHLTKGNTRTELATA
jgi:hypothetical protein